ncbi:MAG: hypothetical protein HYV07_04060 [Deltaproteobacteria bacterium]|nr:hypothetical protein [Deltaproteobacteria bacterium]
MWLATALLMTGCPTVPPVLLDPTSARGAALATPCEPLVDAETLILAGDPLGARERLRGAPESDRRLRLELDAAVALGDLISARRFAASLLEDPGWRAHALRQAGMIERVELRETFTRIGTAMFALSLMLLALGGLRELLKLRKESVSAFLAAGAASFLASFGGPGTPPTAPLVFVSWSFLAHAATAVAYRVEPGGRGRAVVLALVFTGMVGSTLAALALLIAIG